MSMQNFDHKTAALNEAPVNNLQEKTLAEAFKSMPLIRLFLLHVFIIVLSNYSVQIPITVLGIETTVGTFTFPFVFVTTDLTVRLYGAHLARKVIFCAMFPALIASYIVGTIFSFGEYQGVHALATFSIFVFRIAMASFGAYILGQLMDILVFQRLRKLKAWWAAPSASAIVGNLLDTFTFFSIAFYKCVDPYMAENWVHIAWVDYAVKLLVCLILFVPIYGMFLAFLSKYVFRRPITGVGILN